MAEAEGVANLMGDCCVEIAGSEKKVAGTAGVETCVHADVGFHSSEEVLAGHIVRCVRHSALDPAQSEHAA